MCAFAEQGQDDRHARAIANAERIANLDPDDRPYAGSYADLVARAIADVIPDPIAFGRAHFYPNSRTIADPDPEC